MLQPRTNHQGFGVIEGLLILVIVAILGGTGYYVYHADQKTNATYSSAAKVAQAQDKSLAHQPSQKYFVIKEWGVEFKMPARYADDMDYKILPGPNEGVESAYFSLKSLQKLNSACAPAGVWETSLDRTLLGSWPSNAGAGTDPGPLSLSYGPTISQIRGYNYANRYNFEGRTCLVGPDSSSAVKQARATESDFTQVFAANIRQVQSE